jgi:hypothetical protein
MCNVVYNRVLHESHLHIRPLIRTNEHSHHTSDTWVLSNPLRASYWFKLQAWE